MAFLSLAVTIQLRAIVQHYKYSVIGGFFELGWLLKFSTKVNANIVVYIAAVHAYLQMLHLH